MATADGGEDIVQRVMDITAGRGVYGTADAVGGPMTEKLVAATRANGTLLIYGLLASPRFSADIGELLFYTKVGCGLYIFMYTRMSRDIAIRAPLTCH